MFQPPLPVRSARPASPRRVVPGMRMGGHMGDDRVTVRNLEVIDVVTEDNVLVVKGAVPGPNGRVLCWCGGPRGNCDADSRRIRSQ